MERKTLPLFVVKVNEEQGIVEHIVAVMGNTDMGDDVIHPGAFRKTLSERGHKVKVLDLHKTDSVMRVVGKPLELREIGTAELPAQVKERFPEANGALLARTQFLLDTPEGLGVFRRIKAGAVDEYSFGYDAIGPDYGKGKDGRTVRNLREVRLYEYGPVIFGMNPATSTLSAKSGDPSEAKPWDVVREGDKWRVYKLDADGKPTGDALGEFDTEDEARQQVDALFANEPKTDKAAVMKTEEDGEHPASHYLVVEDAQKPSTWHLRVRDMDGKPDHTLMGAAWAALHGGYRGNVYEGPNKPEAISKLTAMYASENMDTPKSSEGEHEGKAGRRMKGDMIEIVKQVESLLAQLRQWANYEEPAPADEQAAKNAKATQAGPSDATPTSDLLRLIEIEQEQIRLLEV